MVAAASAMHRPRLFLSCNRFRGNQPNNPRILCATIFVKLNRLKAKKDGDHRNRLRDSDDPRVGPSSWASCPSARATSRPGWACARRRSWCTGRTCRPPARRAGCTSARRPPASGSRRTGGCPPRPAAPRPHPPARGGSRGASPRRSRTAGPRPSG